METITALKASIMQFLQDSHRFGGVGLVSRFPASERDFPLKRPMIAVGIDSVELGCGGLGGYYGEQQGGSVYGSTAVVTLALEIFAPAREGGDRCHALFEALCDVLVLGQNPFCIGKLACGGVAFDGAVGGNRLAAKASLRVGLTAMEDAVLVERIVAKRVEG